jgi:uncharacterized surface protein with fasciclin (FAS1) repeats
MRILKVVAVLALITVAAVAQVQSQPADLLTAASAESSLNLFAAAVRSSGLARMLKEEGPFTVFAPSDRAFINLAKEDRDVLDKNHAAMRMLLSRYIVRGEIGSDVGSLSSARTLMGVKLRTDDHNGTLYVNGTALRPSQIACSNGVIRVLNHFDPVLVHEAVLTASGR